MTELLPCVELQTGRGEPQYSIVWMHGLGANGHDFEALVPEIHMPEEPAVRFVFPHAPSMPVTVNGGMVMPAWYDIEGIDLESRQDEAGIARSAAAVEALIARENERGIDSSKIILAGFSQGGAVALHVALRHQKQLAGIIAMSTYLLFADRLGAEQSEANKDIPVFMAHGTMDPVVLLQWGEMSRDALVNRGHEVHWHTYEMAHQVCELEVRHLREWLLELL